MMCNGAVTFNVCEGMLESFHTHIYVRGMLGIKSLCYQKVNKNLYNVRKVLRNTHHGAIDLW